MLQVNKTRIFIGFIAIFSLLISCDEEKKDCKISTTILSRLILKKFEKIELQSLYINKIKSDHLLHVNSKGRYIKITPFVFNELEKGTTIFTINDSLHYSISDIKKESIQRQTMTRKIWDCNLVSYKVNDSLQYHHQILTIYRK
ncbi:hypothetical protein [Aquimarina muelleri]|nr:hypothetical protein [Aquimarina muelleri]MCX2764955.1 hypothetical protein [Aquimarina muelleri]